MSFIKKLKHMITPKMISNQVLLHACKTGNVKLAETAIEYGANVNAKKKWGHYHDGVGGRNNPEWVGDIYISPIVYAATSAYGKSNADPYQKIIKLLAQNGADLSSVVSGTEKYWWDDDCYLVGCSPDTVESYCKTLGDVVKERATQKCHYRSFNSPRESYPMSPNMAEYLCQFPKDGLQEKANFIETNSQTEREIRENLSKGTIVEEVRDARNREEKARALAAQRFRSMCERVRE